MIDWNKNGKYDVSDRYIDYQIYNSETYNKNYGSNTSGGTKITLIILMLIFTCIFPPLAILFLVMLMNS